MLFSKDNNAFAEDDIIWTHSRCSLDIREPLSIFVIPHIAFIGVLEKDQVNVTHLTVFETDSPVPNLVRYNGKELRLSP